MNLRRPRILIAIALTTGGLSLVACSGSPATKTEPSPAALAATTATIDSATIDSATIDSATTAADVPASANAAGDACALVTQTEIDTAVGQPLGKGKANAIPGTCQWSTSDFVADVDITVSDWVSIKGAATAGSQPPVSVSGLGDEALNLNGSNGSLLYVRKGDRGFLLTLNGPHIDSLPDHGLAKEKILAVAILQRF